MKILIDTNIFHNSYYIKSIDLRLILSFINNEEHELLLSDIVLKEVEKHFIDGYTSARDKLSSALNEYNRFFPLGDETKVEHLEGFTENDDRNPVKYNFQRQLNKYIDPNKIVIVNSDKVSHNSICNKAFYNKKPFKKDGSGYKDSLIWFSFLEYLADNEIDEEVAFVSNNWKDFSADDKGVKEDKDVCIFHDDLIEDIASYGVKAEIKHFNTISNLISHYGIVNDKYPASYVDVKSYVENGFFDSHLITFLEDSFFKNTQNMSLVEGDGRVDLLFKGNDIYINDFSKAIFDVIQIESSDEGILCRFRLSYNSIELGVTFDKINNNVNEVLTRAYISSSVTDYGDEYSLDLNFSMRIEMTFIYIPKTRKEYDDDYGDLMNMSIQKMFIA